MSRKQRGNNKDRSANDNGTWVPCNWCKALKSVFPWDPQQRSWQRQRGKILRLPMAELAQVCLACARVKYFDSQSFADIIAAVKAREREREREGPNYN